MLADRPIRSACNRTRLLCGRLGLPERPRGHCRALGRVWRSEDVVGSLVGAVGRQGGGRTP
jgi:hypothetical protein